MTPISRRLKSLSQILHNILELDSLDSDPGYIKAHYKPGYQSKCEINQAISIDPETAKALAENCKGDIIIIQSGQINLQLVQLISKALNYVEEIRAIYSDRSLTHSSLGEVLEPLLEEGHTLPSIQKCVEEECLRLVGNLGTNVVAAKKLGISRTSYQNKKKLSEEV